MVYIFAIISILLSAFAQYLLKIGVGTLGWLVTDSIPERLLKLITNLHIIEGIGCYIASMGFWLYILSKMEMSKAYPLTSIGYIFTLLIGVFFLSESISSYKIIGIILIVFGVLIITKS